MTIAGPTILLLLVLLLPPVAAVQAAGGGEAGFDLTKPWPDPDRTGIDGQPVSFPSHSPYGLADVGTGPSQDPPTPARATLFLPPRASAAQPVPAVVMLHGAAGILGSRELTYGRQLAAMGVAGLAVDVFGARKDRGERFLDRLMGITEAMLLADAYAALAYLADRPEVDGHRVALVGFSYGGMATLYAAYRQVAEAYAPGGRRFAAHVAFYAPCIVSFQDHRSTGAPVLMLYGTGDAIVDPERCRAVAAELRAGGSPVQLVAYDGAFHQWDGARPGPRRIGWNLAPCRLEVDAQGAVTDAATGFAMSGSLMRKLILYFCADSDGYLIGRDDQVRARSNQDLGRFLNHIFLGRG